MTYASCLRKFAVAGARELIPQLPAPDLLLYSQLIELREDIANHTALKHGVREKEVVILMYPRSHNRWPHLYLTTDGFFLLTASFEF